jgi:hypothetical protein
MKPTWNQLLLPVSCTFPAQEGEVFLRLKGLKHEKFLAGVVTQIRPVWIGESETRPKTSKT